MVDPVRSETNHLEDCQGKCPPLWETKNCMPDTNLSINEQTFKIGTCACTHESGVVDTVSAINWKFNWNKVDSLRSPWAQV